MSKEPKLVFHPKAKRLETSIVPFWGMAVLFLAMMFYPSLGLFLFSLGFMVGYFYGYLKVFWQAEKAFGSEISTGMFKFFNRDV